MQILLLSYTKGRRHFCDREKLEFQLSVKISVFGSSKPEKVGLQNACTHVRVIIVCVCW